MKQIEKLIIILGQTATGKSDFAVEIAKEINSEIISADSRQVYKGMNLGTGKITKKEMGGIPHYLLDVISPKKIFSVSDFQKMANKKVKEIIKKGKVPIICGGTGFYIDSLINGNIFPEVPPNKKLRKELVNKSTEELFEILKKIDKDRAENIDKNNPVRLIRAIEITKTLGKVPELSISKSNHNILKIGLSLPDEILKERIKNRLISRIKKGMINEVKNLHDKEKISWKRLESLGLEYRYVSLFLQNKLNKEEMIEKLNTEIWHYAKRQKTWFKRDKDIIWINPNKKKDKDLIFKEINKFIKGLFQAKWIIYNFFS
jgi:tRNA dimethylallyltransferase